MPIKKDILFQGSDSHSGVYTDSVSDHFTTWFNIIHFSMFVFPTEYDAIEVIGHLINHCTVTMFII